MEVQRWVPSALRVPAVGAVRWVLSRFGLSRAEVLRDRNVLNAAYPTRHVFKGRGHVYACWLTGGDVLRELDGAPYKHRIRKIILPHPDSTALPTLARTFNQEFDWPSEIRRMTKLARQMGIDVRWHPCFSGTTLTICNPHSYWGWMHMEQVTPHSAPHYRPTFRLRRRADERAFRAVWRSYVRTWREGAQPDFDLSVENAPAPSQNETTAPRVEIEAYNRYTPPHGASITGIRILNHGPAADFQAEIRVDGANYEGWWERGAGGRSRILGGMTDKLEFAESLVRPPSSRTDIIHKSGDRVIKTNLLNFIEPPAQVDWADVPERTIRVVIAADPPLPEAVVLEFRASAFSVSLREDE